MAAILQLKDVTKTYPGVVALDHVSLSLEEGEIHALMGENGAGKSTLIKVISGAVTPDQGTISIGGEEIGQMTPGLSRKLGIGVIYQEFNLVPSLSVAENVFLGDRIGGRFIIDREAMREKTNKLLQQLGVELEPDCMVGELSVAQQQIVEIAKAISQNARVLIMDEPSAALAMAEAEALMTIIRRLKKQGVTILYISHRMDEVFKIAERITVMRDGCYVATVDAKAAQRKDVIALMVGRELKETFPERNTSLGEPVLKVEHLYGNGDRDISLVLRKGEILGLAGLVGAGRTELAKVLYGAVKAEKGIIRIHGREVKIKSPTQAVKHGIGLIPESRKTEGGFLEYPIRWNISIMSLKRMSRFSVVNKEALERQAVELSNALQIKMPSLGQLMRNLSGGNQQKVVVAKVLASEAEILIFDEPTRGIDIGAKQEIYKLMNELVEKGKSIIMISSEMEELIGMSDRILVLHEGEITGEVTKDEFSQQRILALASGE